VDSSHRLPLAGEITFKIGDEVSRYHWEIVSQNPL
jgi:hypothetical protein